MGDFFKLLGASLGWVKEVGADLGFRYYEFLKRAAWVSGFLFIVVLICFVLSATTDMAVFNTLGLLVATGVMVFWVIASQPVVAIGEQLAKIGPIRRIIQRVSTSFLVAFVLVVYSVSAPAGSDGLVRIGVLIILVAGAVLSGLRLTKRTIGIKLVILGLVFAAAVYFPQTTSNISAIRHVVDRSIINSVMPDAKELSLTLGVFEGNGPNVPRLFLNGEPLWWCRRAPDRTAGFRCFDQPGRDQTTNEELMPISQEIVSEVRNRLSAERLRIDAERANQAAERVEAQRLAERKKAEELAAAEAQERERRRLELEATRAAYVRKYVSPSDIETEYGLGILNGTSLDNAFAQRLADRLSELSNPHILREQAVRDGVFARLFRADAVEVKKLRLAEVANQMVLGTLSLDFGENEAIRGTVSADAKLTVNIINPRSAAVIDSFQYASSALGYSESEAKRKAEEELTALAAQRINSQ